MNKQVFTYKVCEVSDIQLEIKGYIWSLELPWCPWAGPHTVQGGAGCG